MYKQLQYKHLKTEQSDGFDHYQNTIRKLNQQSDNIDIYEQLIMQMISSKQLNPTELHTLIALCLNNIAVNYIKDSLMALKLLKFIRNHLLKSELPHYKYSTLTPIHYVALMNLAKVYCQCGKFGKAFISAENSMTLFENYAFNKIKENANYAQPEVVLLVNGYVMLGKSFEQASKQELLSLASKSALLKQGLDSSTKFFDNAKRLSTKYLGPNHYLTKKVLWSSTPKPNQQPLFSRNSIVQIISGKVVVRINQLLSRIKSTLPVNNGTAIDNKQSIQSVLVYGETSRCKTINSDYTVAAHRRLRKKPAVVEDPHSDDTTKETKRVEKSARIQSAIAMEQLMNKKLEEQYKSTIETQTFNQQKFSEMELKYNLMQKEMEKMEKEKRNYQQGYQQQNNIVSTLQSELQDLKQKLTENQLKQEQQLEQFTQLQNEQMKMLALQNNQLQQQMRSQKQSFIHEFQPPLMDSSRNSFPFSFNKVQALIQSAQSEEKSLVATRNQSSAMDLKRIPDKFDKPKLIKLLSETLDEDLSLKFTDSLSGQVLNIVLTPNVVFQLSVSMELEYQLEFELVRQKGRAGTNVLDYYLKITANLANNQTIQEVIEMSNLYDFLQITQNFHNLPYPVRMVTDYKSFIQYLIAPFVQLVNENQEPKIAIWGYPQGMIPEHTLTFMKEQIQCWFHQLSPRQFRIISYNNGQFVCQVEVNFDDEAFNQYFQVVQKDEYADMEMSDIIKLIDLIEEEDQTPIAQLIKKRQERQVLKLPSISIKDKQKLLSFIQNTIQQTEEYLRQLQIVKITQLQDGLYNQEIKLIQMRLIGSKQTLIVFTGGNDKIHIRMKNLYQTHAPEKQLVFAQGSQLIDEKFIQERFQVCLSVLDVADRLFLLGRIAELFKLDVFDKVLEEDDYDCYRENAITTIPQDFGGTHRIYTGDPLTLTLIGANDKPQFVRAELYNQDTIESQGVLFAVTSECWLREVALPTQVNGKKKRQQRYISEVPICQKYYLSNVLHACGWQVLIQQLLMSDDKFLFIGNPKQEQLISRLESHLNFKSIFECLYRK